MAVLPLSCRKKRHAAALLLPPGIPGPGYAGAGVGSASMCGLEGRREKNKTRTTYFCLGAQNSTYLPFFYFFEFFLLRFWVFLGMGNPETAKKLFWNFFGHDQKATS